MTFFYDLNKRLADLSAKQITEDAKAQDPKSKLAESSQVDEAGYSAKAARAGKDIGKPGKNFEKIAKGAAERYGSKAAGERVAGAVLNKLRHPKEDIENEGNAFTAALKSTPKGGKFKVGGKEFTDTSSIDEGFKEMDAWLKSRESEKGTGNFDKKERTLPGGMKATTYTRKFQDEPEDDADAPVSKGGNPLKTRKAGRPAGTKRAIGAKGPNLDKMKAKINKEKHVSEEETDEGWRGGMLGEPSVVKTGKKDPNAKVEAWNGLMAIVARGQGMEPAVLKHLKQIARTLKPEELELDEEKVEAGKREFFDRLAPAAKKAAKVIKSISKGKKAVDEESTDEEDTKAEKAGKKVTKDIESDDKKDRKEKKSKGAKPDFNDVDDDGDEKESWKNAEKDKEEKVDETTVSGSVATASGPAKDPGAPKAAKASKGGMKFGQGVYEAAISESYNKKLSTMLNEGVNISAQVSQDEGNESEQHLTVDASGEDADKLAEILKLAGMEQSSGYSDVCPKCGTSSCGCEPVEEDYANSPEEEYADTDTMVNTLSGGLNGRKSSGQTTIPVVNRDPRRGSLGAIAEEIKEESESHLWNLYKSYGK